jgi:hypothetical protein
MPEGILNYLILVYAKTQKFVKIKLITKLHKKLNLVYKLISRKNSYIKIKDKELFRKWALPITLPLKY